MAFGQNPEFAAMNNLDREKRGDKIKQTAERLIPMHEKIAPVLEQLAFNPDDFPDYDQDGIARDKAYVKQRKAAFAAEANDPFPGVKGLTKGDVKKLADIAEYQILRGINLGGWIPYMEAFVTAPSDEIGAGIDSIWEFAPPGQVGHLGLGIDVSFSHNLDGKFKRAKDEIDEYDGKDNILGQVKYFKSKKSGIIGRLTGLPRLVAALDIGVLEDLNKTKDTKGHMAQHALITEMEQQLAVYVEYAADTNSGATPDLIRAQNFISKISQHLDSEEVLKRSEYRKNEDVVAAIKKGLRQFS